MDWPFFMTLYRFVIPFCFLFPSFASSNEISFTKKQIVINGKVVSVEVAESNAQRQRGLMKRTSMGKNQGMIFVFERPQQLSFWMKNTLIPLSIGFFDKDRKLLNIEQMHPPKSVMVQDNELERYSSQGLAKYALEMNLGWFKTNKVVPGAQFQWK